MERAVYGRRLPIGTENFKKLITDQTYYVDKTLFLRDFKDYKGDVNLFLRPRRFGKTLTLSMLKYFYEDTGIPELNNENRALFDGLKISKESEEYRADMTSYPVISLTLKSAKQGSFDDAFMRLRIGIANEFDRHDAMLRKLSDKEIIEKLDYIHRYCGASLADPSEAAFKESVNFFKESLTFLSNCLYKAYHKKVIILIYEYDVALESAYFGGYYKEMIEFIRTLFESGFKTNPNIEFAVITGCLRVARESLFTGFNNLSINSMAVNDYGEYFGFTQAEIDKALIDFEHPQLGEEMRRWYNGYRFGEQSIYNPWSVINCLKEIRMREPFPFRSNWANTSSNDIVRTLVEKADRKTRDEVETLTNGGSVEKQIHEDVTYAEMLESDDNLFIFLYFTGYLTSESIRKDGDDLLAKLIIPNTEVKTIYRRKIMEWFEKETKKKDFTALYKAIEDGDCETIGNTLKKELRETISYFDYDEKYYHGFLTGLLLANGNRTVRSNRESGEGRYDLALIPDDMNDEVIIIEVKAAKTRKEIEGKFEEAENQIRTRDYPAEFENDGYEHFMVYAAVFFKKSVEIRLIS